MSERAGVPIPRYPGVPPTGTRGRKHEPDSPEAAAAHERVRRFAADPEHRAQALANDAAVKPTTTP